MENILELINVSKSYKDFSLKQVNISLKPGYIMGFIGPNGAGKSTTIKLIMGLVKNEEGEINIFGLDQKKHALAIKDRIGFVYDENQGMKMKFSLAVALSHDAELLIMDEPTSGLDPLIRSELLEILQSIIQNENKSVFFSSHITSDLEKIADYITIIHNGQILLSSTKDELLDDYCMIKGTKEKLSEMNREHLIAIKENSFGFEALANNKREIMKQYGSTVLIEKPTLDDIMLYTILRGEQRVSTY